MNHEANAQAEALSIDDVRRIAGIGRTTVYKLINSGALPARKLGRRTLVMRSDLASCLDGLPKAAGTEQPSSNPDLSSRSEVGAISRETPKTRLSRSLRRRSASQP